MVNRLKKLAFRMANVGIPRIREAGVHSQYGQDRFVAESLFKGKRSGVFVDVGANDGETFSNTCFLERELGWTGVAIEPLPKAFEKLARNRSCHALQCCIAEKEGDVNFLEIDGNAEMLSGIVDSYDERHLRRIDDELATRGGSKREIKVKCHRLSTILDRHSLSEVDYLSIDTEGNEMDVLRSVDLSAQLVRVISVENNYGSSDLRKRLGQFGYKLVALAGADEIYERRT
ncbi:MAG: FkbM family methyltransferase [Limisphaerales bacterium]|jgi:FkbM family methyltransferase